MMSKTKADKPNKPSINWLTLILSLCAFVTSLLVMFHLLFGLIQVSGISMSPTYGENETIVVNKVKTPKRFDIIILNEVRSDGTSHIVIKRLIGLPNDDVTVLDGALFINGIQYQEPYTAGENRIDFDKASFHTKVPEGNYFVMGDNRDNSTDSRDVGHFTTESLIGVVQSFEGVFE